MSRLGLGLALALVSGSAHAADVLVLPMVSGPHIEAYQAQRFDRKSDLYLRWFTEELQAAGLSIQRGGDIQLSLLPTLGIMDCDSGLGMEMCRVMVTWSLRDHQSDQIIWEASTVSEYQRRRNESSGGMVGYATGEYGANERVQARDGALLLSAQQIPTDPTFEQALRQRTMVMGPVATPGPFGPLPEGHMRPARDRILGAGIALISGLVFAYSLPFTAFDIEQGRVGAPTIIASVAGLGLIGGAGLSISGQIRVGKYWRNYLPTRPMVRAKL